MPYFICSEGRRQCSGFSLAGFLVMPLWVLQMFSIALRLWLNLTNVSTEFIGIGSYWVDPSWGGWSPPPLQGGFEPFWDMSICVFNKLATLQSTSADPVFLFIQAVLNETVEDMTTANSLAPNVMNPPENISADLGEKQFITVTCKGKRPR